MQSTIPNLLIQALMQYTAPLFCPVCKFAHLAVIQDGHSLQIA